MTTTTLRPDGTSAAGGWVTVGGPGTLHGNTSDDSDASRDQTSSTTSTMRLTFGTATIPGVINSVTLRIRFANGSIANDFTMAQYVGGSTSASDTITGNTTIGTVSGAARTTKPGGGAWDQAAIDALEVVVTSDVGGDNYFVYELYADVDYTVSSQTHQMIV